MIAKKPKLSSNLFFCNIGTCNGDNGAPSTFNEAVRGLAAGRSSNNGTFGFVYPLEGFTTDQLFIKVRVKLAGNATSIGTKGLECSDNVIGGK